MNGFAVFFLFLILILILVIMVIVWIFVRYSKPRQEYGVKSVTLRGETVKSIGERRIADYLTKNHIYYLYEQKPRGNLYTLPDFYLPVYDVYVEYWGLVDVDDRWTREKYERNMKRKMAIYHRNNIKFISIYPDNLENLDWILRKKFKEVTGFDLLY